MSECRHGKQSVFCKYCDAATVEKYSQARMSDSSNNSRKFEDEYAIKEGERVNAENEYFKYRPQIDNTDRRRIFDAGFDRGYEAAQSHHEAELVEQRLKHSEEREALEKRIDDLDESESQLISERDCAESWADGLAAAANKIIKALANQQPTTDKEVK